MINTDKLLETIHVRTYYLAERNKKEDPSLAIIQTSEDNKDILIGFLQSAVNEVKGKMIKRTLSFSMDIDSGIFEVISKREKSEQVISLLERAVEDCIVEYVLLSWLRGTAPELADPSGFLLKQEEVDKYISMLSSIPRRRPTDLAGI